MRYRGTSRNCVPAEACYFFKQGLKENINLRIVSCIGHNVIQGVNVSVKGLGLLESIQPAASNETWCFSNDGLHH